MSLMSLAHWIFLHFVPRISIKVSYNFKNTDSKYNSCTKFYFHLKFVLWNVGRVSSVRISTRYALDGPGIEPQWGRDFLHPSRPVPGPIQPPIQWEVALTTAEGKERIGLYLHARFGSSWPVLGWTLLLLILWSMKQLILSNKITGQTGKQFLFLACVSAIYSTYPQFRTDFIGNKMKQPICMLLKLNNQ
jgi:hypothetical protein